MPVRKPGKPRVLVLEDEPLIRQLLVANLRQGGFEVAETEDVRHDLLDQLTKPEQNDDGLTEAVDPDNTGDVEDA